MKIEVYCDECRPDLLSSRNPQASYMVIGGLWLKTEDRDAFKEAIHRLRDKHKVGGEFKWQKVSPSRFHFYKDLVDWYFVQGDNLRFRCIAVDRQKIDLLRFHENDQELGFYKFYYQMLHHWIGDFNEYVVFCDFKSNRRRDRLHVLQQCLARSNLSSEVVNVQAVRSKESVFIQLVDVLTGIATARLNGIIASGSAKARIVAHLEKHLPGGRIIHTSKSEKKFNVFVIDLQGDW